MFSKDLKQLLDEKYLEYNKSEFFIETDPIQIPKCFEEKGRWRGRTVIQYQC